MEVSPALRSLWRREKGRLDLYLAFGYIALQGVGLLCFGFMMDTMNVCMADSVNIWCIIQQRYRKRLICSLVFNGDEE